MTNDILWFAYLCADKGLVSSAVCRQIAAALGDRMDLLLFAETLLANDFCSSKERLQAIINEAWRKAQTGGPPPMNVFAGEEPAWQKKRKSIPFRKRGSTETAAPSPASEAAAPPPTDSAPAPPTAAEPEPAAAPGSSKVIKTIQFGPQPDVDLAPVPPPKKQPAASKVIKQISMSSTIDVEEETAATAATRAGEPPVETTPKLQKKNETRAPTLLDFDIANIQAEAFDFENIESMADQELKESMAKLLLSAQMTGASDLHISAGARPFARHYGRLEFLADKVLTAKEAEQLNCALLTADQKDAFLAQQDYDLALALGERNRFRVNLMVHKEGPSGTYHVVPNRIRSLEELGFTNADTIRQLLDFHNGLILVTGPVGCGKTTTMASLVDELNRNRRDHIITVENPIEIIQTAANCNVTQREVGRHTENFKTALKAALREDPDVIVIGELSDLETIEMAITASETGHLVVGTLHTADAATTLSRLLDVFPPAQQPQIRAMVAESLRGIVCQRLLPSTDGGRVVACELLLNTLAVSNLIREGKSHALKAVLETGVKQGMCLMDTYILGLWQKQRITDAVASMYIRDRGVRNRIKSQKQLGDAGAHTVQTQASAAGKKKWGLF